MSREVETILDSRHRVSQQGSLNKTNLLPLIERGMCLTSKRGNIQAPPKLISESVPRVFPQLVKRWLRLLKAKINISQTLITTNHVQRGHGDNDMSAGYLLGTSPRGVGANITTVRNRELEYSKPETAFSQNLGFLLAFP